MKGRLFVLLEGGGGVSKPFRQGEMVLIMGKRGCERTFFTGSSVGEMGEYE